MHTFSPNQVIPSQKINENFANLANGTEQEDNNNLLTMRAELFNDFIQTGANWFFSGGLIGGFLYSKLDLKLNALIFAALILIVSLFFDDFRYHIIKTRRKYNQKKTNQKETFLHS